MHNYLLPLLLALGAPAAEPADVVVVCPPAYREAAQPWIDRRTQQGHVIECLSNSGTAEEIQRQIRGLAKNGKLRFVLLIGDGDMGGKRVDAHQQLARISKRAGLRAVAGAAQARLDFHGGPTRREHLIMLART